MRLGLPVSAATGTTTRGAAQVVPRRSAAGWRVAGALRPLAHLLPRVWTCVLEVPDTRGTLQLIQTGTHGGRCKPEGCARWPASSCGSQRGRWSTSSDKHRPQPQGGSHAPCAQMSSATTSSSVIWCSLRVSRVGVATRTPLRTACDALRFPSIMSASPGRRRTIPRSRG